MSVFTRRVRGFRLIDVVALGLLVLLIMSVYLAKTMASRERAQIARVEREISSETARIRLLEAEVAHLEQPSRIERLSTAYLEMAPVTVDQETTPDTLAIVALPKVSRP
ncbi:MAG: cell division protein [Phenylobacterium sp.]|uniref:cell division protein FtsL n=1 Tax=Phenylobacterium sp. TaxID=1871053 RepID=UPI002715F387|nr:cell division protein [Phenylobacterium sp.]MDO8411146.1 cell division protein [Phenylobacterium sp.]